MPTNKLTPNFTFEELTLSETATRHRIANDPNDRQLANLKRVAETLEQVRAMLGHEAIMITSGYRSPEVNRLIGGAANSAHMSGLAVDFVMTEFTPLEICHGLAPRLVELRIDQLILEFGRWTHLGLIEGDPRHMALTIDHRGTRSGFG